VNGVPASFITRKLPSYPIRGVRGGAFRRKYYQWGD